MKLLYLPFFFLSFFLACKPLKKEQPVTGPEAIAYAKSIETAIKKGDKNILNRVLDENLFADEVAKAAGQESNKELKRGVKDGFQKQNLSRQVFNNLGDDGSYEFVKQYEKGGHQHIIFRLHGEGGLNYHDFELVKYDENIKAKDIYIYLSGENLSSTMAQIVGAMIEQDKKNSLSIKDQSKTLIRLKTLQQQQKFEEAKELFDKLPEAMRKERVFQLLNIQITSEMDQSTYSTALTEFENLYGHDGSAQLALFDGYFLKGDYDRSLKILDAVDKDVQDPMLDYYRSLIYTQKKDDTTAIKYLEKLQKNVPDFQNGTLELLANYLALNQYDKAEKIATVYKANKSFKQDRLNDIKLLYPEAAKKINW